MILSGTPSQGIIFWRQIRFGLLYCPVWLVTCFAAFIYNYCKKHFTYLSLNWYKIIINFIPFSTSICMFWTIFHKFYLIIFISCLWQDPSQYQLCGDRCIHRSVPCNGACRTGYFLCGTSQCQPDNMRGNYYSCGDRCLWYSQPCQVSVTVTVFVSTYL